MPTGTVKLLLDKQGYGFIAVPDGRDVFFAHDAVPSNGFRKLAVGQAVEYELASQSGKSAKGPRAKTVSPAASRETASDAT
jgi:CspA family cold shock protein